MLGSYLCNYFLDNKEPLGRSVVALSKGDNHYVSNAKWICFVLDVQWLYPSDEMISSSYR